MNYPNEKLERLKLIRKSIKSEPTEKRVDQVKLLIEKLDELGKNNFPLAPTRWDDERSDNL